MIETFSTYAASLGLDVTEIAVAGIGMGMLIFVLGFAAAVSGRDPVRQRIAAQAPRSAGGFERGILRPEGEGAGVLKGFIPSDERERSEIRLNLAAAGITGPNAVLNYTLARLCLGFLVPAAFAAVAVGAQRGVVSLPERLDLAITGLTSFGLLQVVAILVAIGFFGPAYWLRARANDRRRRISEAFPNALDLIQISAEAGLGFDAAMIRVANEIATSAPELSQELLFAQREIQAGRSRDRALVDMAQRTGVDEVGAFVNVVLQSIQFGTSISGTLTAYAREMRQNREIKAQEKANKLPVQMSAVMASLMLPALIMMTLGPVVIRYIRYFSG